MQVDRLWTLDVGNTRAKLREWRLVGGLTRVASHEWRLDDVLAGLRALLASGAIELESTGCALSCVAARELECDLSAQLFERLGERHFGSPDSGLDNQCVPPEGVGRDRLFAARGAFERVGRSAIVVDIGTAMTVDALVVADRPRFAGGAIAAGPTLLAGALRSSTARLPLVEPRADALALGRDTASAIASGLRYGIRGAAKELVRAIAAEASIDSAPLVLTGGAASWLQSPELFVGSELHCEPDLVHIGLLCAALDQLTGARTVRRYDVPRE